MWRTVLVDPPIAISSAKASSIASLVIMSRGLTSSLIIRTNCFAASLINLCRSFDVATIVPLPGSVTPSISIRQFMELAVNIPEHEPHVGHALFSISSSSASLILPDLSAPTPSNTEVSDSCLPVEDTPASIGPPETKIEGTFVRTAAINIPGVILSQFGI